MLIKRTVIVRADGSKQIGYGHFIRSLALAGYLKDYFNCIFYSFNPSEKKLTTYQKEEIAKVCTYVEIPADTYKDYDMKFLDTLTGQEIVVLDNYYFSTDYQQKIKDKGCILVCIDDVHDRHFVADAVLTGTPAKRELFSLSPDAYFLNGLEHHYLRPPFLNDNLIPQKGNEIKKIIMAIGGTDPYRLSNKIASIIYEIAPEIQLSIIAGDNVSINHNLITPTTRILRRLSAEDIVKEFTDANLGIFPASTICVEALACGLPTAAGWYVDNQKEFYDWGVKEKYFLPLGNFLSDEELIRKNICKALEDLKNYKIPKINFIQGKQDIIKLFQTLDSNVENLHHS